MKQKEKNILVHLPRAPLGKAEKVVDSPRGTLGKAEKWSICREGSRQRSPPAWPNSQLRFPKKNLILCRDHSCQLSAKTFSRKKKIKFLCRELGQVALGKAAVNRQQP